MKIKREIVTPYLVFIFLAVALSGILMFFHLFDNYTNVVHELLGLTFVLFVALHIIKNWKSIGNYSRKKLFIFPSIAILIISITFIIVGKARGNFENNILEKLLKSPVSVSFKVLNVNYKEAETIFRQNNLIIRDSLESIEEISLKNKKSPEDIIKLIYK
jgi:hypothetical protein